MFLKKLVFILCAVTALCQFNQAEALLGMLTTYSRKNNTIDKILLANLNQSTSNTWDRKRPPIAAEYNMWSGYCLESERNRNENFNRYFTFDIMDYAKHPTVHSKDDYIAFLKDKMGPAYYLVTLENNDSSTLYELINYPRIDREYYLEWIVSLGNGKYRLYSYKTLNNIPTEQEKQKIFAMFKNMEQQIANVK